MNRQVFTQYRPGSRFVVLLLVFLSIGIGVGAITAQGIVWDVGDVNDIQVGDYEDQTITDITVENVDGPVTVDVGELVENGAVFSSDPSNYNITNGQTANESEVFIRNPESPHATIVIEDSALDENSIFDLTISQINTTNISKYNEELEERDIRVSYTIEEGGYRESVDFMVYSSSEVTLSSEAYNSGNKTIDVESLNMNNDSREKVLIWNLNSNGKPDQKIGSSKDNETEIDINTSIVSGKTDIAVTINPINSNTSKATIYSADETTAAFPIRPEITSNPIYYPNKTLDSEQNGIVTMKFNTEINKSTGVFDIEYFNTSNESVRLGDDEEYYSINKNKVEIYPQRTTESDSGPLQVKQIETENLSSEIGGNSSSEQYQVKRIGETISTKSNVSVEAGTNIAIRSNSADKITIESHAQEYQRDLSDSSREIILLDTSEVPPGNYTVRSDSDINQSKISIVNSSLSIDGQNEFAIGNASLKISEENVSRYLGVDINHENSNYHSRLKTVTETSTNTSIPLELTKTGSYQLHVFDFESNTSKTKNLTAVEQKSTNISTLRDGYGTKVGENIDTEISKTYDDFSIRLTNTTDQSTAATANLTTTGNETISLTLNTYATGDTTLTDDLVTAGPGATVESVETVGANETLPPGTYELAVRSAHGSVTTADTTTVTVESRSTDELQVYTTDALDPDAFDTSADIHEAVGADTLSPSTTINSSETVVYEVAASGLTGLPAARNATLEAGADIDRFDGFDFGLRSRSTTESELALTAASDTDDVGPAPADATVHVDDAGLYLVAAGEDAVPEDDPDDGAEFTAAFRVEDERLRSAADPGDDHTATTDLTYVDSTAASDPIDDGASGDTDAADGGGGRSAGGGGGAGATGSGPASGGPTAPDESPSPNLGPHEQPGDPIASVTVGSGSRVRAVADLETTYRDHPDATADGTPRPAAALTADATTETEPSTHPRSAAERDAVDGGTEADDTVADSESDDTVAEPDAPAYENAPIRSTAYDVPGFGLVAAVFAVVGFARLAARRE